jgi:hypothetical protein
LVLGLALGLFFVGPLRLAQGRGPVSILLLAMPLVGWGLARRLEMSPLALLFAAGVVLANEASKRDLIFTLLRELQRPFTFLVLLLAGARIPIALIPGAIAVFGLMAAGYSLSRPLAWRFAPDVGLSIEQALPMSPLAIVLTLELLDWAGTPSGFARLLPAVVALAFVLNEAAWFLISRSRVTASREVDA